MNKPIVIILIVLIAAALAACARPKEGGEPAPTAAPTPDGADADKLSAYAIFPADSVYVYEGDADTMRDWTVYHDYVGGKTQKRFITEMASTVEVIEVSNGELKQVYGTAIANALGRIAHADYRDQPPTADIVLLKEPIEKGAKWVQSEQSGNGVMSEITAVGLPVTVPYGTFNCVEVTTIYKEGQSEERCYYAPGVGLVKVTTILGGNEGSSELSQVLEGETISEPHVLFYPDGGSEGHETVSVAFATNDAPQDALAAVARPILEARFGLDLSAAAINGVTIDPTTRQATVDFSKSVLTLMNKTPDVETEELILQCAADTFAYLLGADDVRFLLDGAAYVSDKVSLNEEDFIRVKMTAQIGDE